MSTISAYTGDGSTTQFDITFTYRSASTVKASVDGVETEDFTFVNPSRIEFADAPASGAEIKIFRRTPVTPPEVEFEDGAIIRGDDLNDAIAQARDRVEEVDSDVGFLSNAAVRGPTGETLDALPEATDRANQYLVFDADGNPSLSSGTGADAGLRADLAEDGGSLIGVGETTLDAVLAKVTPQEYGAVGDGVTDDTAAIQAAIDAVTSTGGTVFFPSANGERYLITGALLVSSRFGVNLVSEMNGLIGSKASSSSAIIVGAAVSSVIKYEAPNSGMRAEHGAGLISGLAIVDITGASDGVPGDYSVTDAAIHLKDFSGGLVQDCTIQWIKGRAILTDFAVMSSIRGGKVRYCGDTAAPTNGVIELGATSASITTQSFSISDVRLEVNHAVYIKATNTFVKDVKIRGCQFEAATTEYPTSSKTFVDIGIERYLVGSNGFNRNDAVPVKAGGRGQITNNIFANAGGSRESLLLSGDRILAEGNHFEDNGTAFSIISTGVRNKIANNVLYSSGGIQNTGRGGQIIGNEIDEPTQTTGDAIIDLSGGADKCAGNYINDGSTTPVVDGIISRGVDLVTGNMFDGWSAMAAIRAENANASVEGNLFAVVVTPFAGVAALGGLNINGTKVLGPRGAAVADATLGATGGIAVAAGANPTKAEFDALVAAYNDLAAKFNAAGALWNAHLARSRSHGLLAP